MPNTDDERLALLLAKRDAAEDALLTGKAFVEIEHRNRRIRVEGRLEVLEYLNSEIKKLQQKSLRAPARNRARLRR